MEGYSNSITVILEGGEKLIFAPKFNKELNFVAHINLNKKTISVPDSKHSFNLDAFESVVLKKR